eukprot:TRINITY_DN3405_c0_g1_i2.p1 TRINITY_DN3405_c0_g1~~TRINITY_DN3405_c0_g1_i2.p1  ORF type:complete len:270 (-),score=52.31 TRINITY_DN3405_c0_g1_i2:123-932(-)
MKLVQLSTRPRLFSCENFLTPKECERMVQITKQRLMFEDTNNPKAIPFPFNLEEDDTIDSQDRKLLLSIEDRVAQFTGTPRHDLEVGVQLQHVKITPNERNGYQNHDLHVDTNRRFFRYATALVYLNTLPKEHFGHTCFPFAGADEKSPVIQSSRYLLKSDIHHTIRASAGPSSITGAAKRMVNFSNLQHGVQVEPQVGKLILFYTRDQNGDIDPFSWHGGVDVLGTGKWTMQLFKEVPEKYRKSEQDWRGYIRSKWDLPESFLNNSVD